MCVNCTEAGKNMTRVPKTMTQLQGTTRNDIGASQPPAEGDIK
jgi:hypothetical protein